MLMPPVIPEPVPIGPIIPSEPIQPVEPIDPIIDPVPKNKPQKPIQL